MAMQMLAWLLLEPGYLAVNFPSNSSLLPFSRPVPCKEQAGGLQTCASRRLPGLAQHRAGMQDSMQTSKVLCSRVWMTVFQFAGACTCQQTVRRMEQ